MIIPPDLPYRARTINGGSLVVPSNFGYRVDRTKHDQKTGLWWAQHTTSKAVLNL